MMENVDNNPNHQHQHHHHQHPAGRHSLYSAVVSGDSEDDDDTGDDINEDIFVNHQETDDDNNYSDAGHGDGSLYAQKPFHSSNSNNNNDDDDGLYDKDLDEENEAYVYKYLRGGTKEKVQVVVKNNMNQQQQDHQQETHNREKSDSTATTTRHIHAYKPRNTDPVLSCPCCFNLLCMDCQRHAKYSNQYRAMFVMGIIVDWHTRLVYDEQRQHLQKRVSMNIATPANLNNQKIVPTFADDSNVDCVEEGQSKGGIPYYDEGEYFLVQCADCRTEVAALDMKDEVYHFHGCLES